MLFTIAANLFPSFLSVLESFLFPLKPFPEIPPELLAEILSHLPVQSLLRFRSTSKSLKSLIDSHNFINLHLKNSTNFNLIIRYDHNLYLTDFPNLTTRIKLPFPFRLCSPDSIIGSCNGLLCIRHGDDSGPMEIAFWNPYNHKHIILPPIFKGINGLSRIDNHGFGFDPFAGDYKYVLIACFFDDIPFTFHSAVKLFSLKSNSWKQLPSIPYILHCRENSVGFLVDNSIHWVVRRPLLILAFNLTLEIFNEVPLPEIGLVNGGSSFAIDVGGLGECLCMTVKYQTTKVDIWVMKEYGARDSWCKLFTLVELFLNSPLTQRSLTSLRPLCYSSDRSEVLLVASVFLKRLLVASVESYFYKNLSKLFWYNLKTEEITYVQRIPDNVTDVMVCAESLVPPSLPI